MRTAFILICLVAAALVAGAGASIPTLPEGFTLPPTTLPATDPAVPTTVVTPIVTVSGNQLQVVSTQLDPSVLMRGDRGTLVIDVANTGTVPVRVSEATLSADGAVTVEDDPYRTVGVIGAGNRMSFTFSVRAGSPDGIAYPVFSLTVPDGRGLRVPVPVRVDSTSPAVSFIERPDVFTSGRSDVVVLSIGNPRQAALNGVMASPRGTGYTSKPSSVFIGELPMNGQARASFNLTPEENATLGFDLVYFNGLNRHVLPIDLPVEFGESKQRAELLLSNFVLEQRGGIYKLTGDINNAGLRPARSVVIAPGQEMDPADPYPRYVIGSLEPDDFASFELNFRAADGGPVPLIISYKDDNGNAFEEHARASTSVNQTEEGGSASPGEPVPLVWIGLGLVLAVGIGYLIVRSWRR